MSALSTSVILTQAILVVFAVAGKHGNNKGHKAMEYHYGNFTEHNDTQQATTIGLPTPPSDADFSNETTASSSHVATTTMKITTTTSQGNPCLLPKLTGNCKAFLRRFYFDASESTCKQFIYGGCGGNSNNFAKSEQCERTCSSRKDDATSTAESSLKPTAGPPSSPSPVGPGAFLHRTTRKQGKAVSEQQSATAAHSRRTSSIL